MSSEIKQTVDYVTRFIIDKSASHGLEKAIKIAKSINDGAGFSFYIEKGGKYVKLSECTISDELFEQASKRPCEGDRPSLLRCSQSGCHCA